MIKKLKDKKIKILKFQETKDEDGFPIKEWVPIHTGTLWAYFRLLSGKEYFASASIQLEEECLFIINWRDDIDTDMKIKYKNQYYDITRIDVFEDYKRDISIYAKLAENAH